MGTIALLKNAFYKIGMLPSFPIGDNNHIKRSIGLLFDDETQIRPARASCPGEESSLSSPFLRGMRGRSGSGIRAIFIHGFRRLLTLMLSPLFACKSCDRPIKKRRVRSTATRPNNMRTLFFLTNEMCFRWRTVSY